MFNKIIHVLKSLRQEDPNQVQEVLQKVHEQSFIYDLTNGRPKGFNREAVLSGHQKIGDFIHRGIQIQTNKIKGGL